MWFKEANGTSLIHVIQKCSYSVLIKSPSRIALCGGGSGKKNITAFVDASGKKYWC